MTLKSLRFRGSPEENATTLDFGDGKSPERRRADARRAHYEHQRRLLDVKNVERLVASLREPVLPA